MILCGNKSDLEPQRVVTYEEGENLAKKHDMMFIETSALSGANIELAFNTISSILIDSKPQPHSEQRHTQIEN